MQHQIFPFSSYSINCIVRPKAKISIGSIIDGNQYKLKYCLILLSVNMLKIWSDLIYKIMNVYNHLMDYQQHPFFVFSSWPLLKLSNFIPFVFNVILPLLFKMLSSFLDVSKSDFVYFLFSLINYSHAKFKAYFMFSPVLALTSKNFKPYYWDLASISYFVTCLSSRSHLFANNKVTHFYPMFWLQRSIHSGRCVKLLSSHLQNYLLVTSNTKNAMTAYLR